MCSNSRKEKFKMKHCEEGAYLLVLPVYLHCAAGYSNLVDRRAAVERVDTAY